MFINEAGMRSLLSTSPVPNASEIAKQSVIATETCFIRKEIEKISCIQDALSQIMVPLDVQTIVIRISKHMSYKGGYNIDLFQSSAKQAFCKKMSIERRKD